MHPTGATGSLDSGWRRNDGWYGTESACDWSGIYCNDDGLVTTLNPCKLFLRIIGSNNNTIFSLVELTIFFSYRFFAADNNLKGSIPSGISQLTALKVLYLGKLLCIGWFQRQHYTPLIQVLTPLSTAFQQIRMT